MKVETASQSAKESRERPAGRVLGSALGTPQGRAVSRSPTLLLGSLLLLGACSSASSSYFALRSRLVCGLSLEETQLRLKPEIPSLACQVEGYGDQVCYAALAGRHAMRLVFGPRDHLTSIEHRRHGPLTRVVTLEEEVLCSEDVGASPSGP